MRQITVPKDIAILDRDEKPVLLDGNPMVVSHRAFVLDNLLAHPEAGRGGGDALRRLLRVQSLFGKCMPGDKVSIEDADYQFFRAILDQLVWGPQFIRFAPQVLPHVEAWERASEATS